MTPSPSLIDEIEDALAAKSEETRAAALWRITDLFMPVRFQGAMVYQAAGSGAWSEDDR